MAETLPLSEDRRLHPWPGLAPYLEADAAYFHGRTAELAQLETLIERDILTVLFGVSGTGKSSLLRAGLFPALRQRGSLPVPVRLDYRAEAPSIARQLSDAVRRAATDAKIEMEETVPPLRAGQESAWEFLQRHDLWNAQNELVRPVMVIDQFEELFTVGRGSLRTGEALEELADLAENTIPDALRTMAGGSASSGTTRLPFDAARPRWKVVIGVREDFVPRLDELRRLIPSIMRNRLRLTRMNGVSATKVLLEPGAGIIDAPTADALVRSVAATREKGSISADQLPLAELQIEPALLSVVARELNNRRRLLNLPAITGELVNQAQGDILANFYESALAGVPANVRRFLENRLLTASGYRNTVSVEEAEAEGIPDDTIRLLVDRRLVRVEERLGRPHLELTHDLLTTVAAESARKRRERESRRRAVRLIAIISSAAVLAAVVAIGSLSLYRRAARAEAEASKSADQAVSQKKAAEKSRDEAVTARQRAELAEAQARGSAAEALSQKKAADATRNASERLFATSSVQLANLWLKENRSELALESLAQSPEQYRNWDWGYARSRVNPELARFQRSDHAPRRAVWSPTAGRFITTTGRLFVRDLKPFSNDYNSALLWDAATGALVATLRGHTGDVESAVFSPDGTRIVTTSKDETARVWDAATGAPVATLQGHRNWVLSAAFSPDGAHIVTASYDETARVWDAATGAHTAMLQGHTRSVTSAAFSPDGARIVTASDDKTARVWDVATGAPLATLEGHTDALWSAEFSANGARVVTTSLDHTARVWDASTGAPAGQVLESIRAISPDLTKVIAQGDQDVPRVLEIGTGVEITKLKGYSHDIRVAQFSADGAKFLSYSLDNTVRLWNATTGAPLATLEGHAEFLSWAVFSPTGTAIMTCSFDDTARLWDGASHSFATDDVNAAEFSPDGARIVIGAVGHTARDRDAATGATISTLERHSVSSSAFSPEGTRIVTASYDETARVWDATTGVAIAALQGHTNGVNSAEFSPDGARIVTASQDKTARVWGAATGAPFATLQGHTDWVLSAAFSPDGTRIVTASRDSTARVWDAATGALVATLKGHNAGVLTAAFSPDSARIVTASGDKTARVWDAATGAPDATLQGHTRDVNSAEFSPDGTQIVTASDDNTARVWDAATGVPTATLQGHTRDVISAAFSPDGSRIVTASDDNTAHVWEAGSGALVATLQGHVKVVNSAEFSLDGTIILTASSDGTARIWEAAPWRENPGSAGSDGLPIEEQFTLWKMQKYRDWQVRQYVNTLGEETLYGDPRVQAFRDELTAKFRAAYPQWAQWF